MLKLVHCSGSDEARRIVDRVSHAQLVRSRLPDDAAEARADITRAIGWMIDKYNEETESLLAR